MKSFLLFCGATLGLGTLAVVWLILAMQSRTTDLDASPADTLEVAEGTRELTSKPAKSKAPRSRPVPVNSQVALGTTAAASMQTTSPVTDLALVPLPVLTDVSGKPQKTILNQLRDRQIQKWFPDGDRLLVLHLSVMRPSRISVVEVATGQEAWSHRTDRELRAATVSADGSMIAIAERGGSLACYDAATGNVTQTIDGPEAVGGAENVTDLRFDDTGSTIITVHFDRTVRTWDMASRNELSRFQVGDHQTHLVGFTGPWLHTRNSEKHQWWAIDQAKPKLHFEVDREHRLAELAPDGRLLAINAGSEVGILNVAEGRVHRTLSVPASPPAEQLARAARGLTSRVVVLAGSFSADGNRFAVSTSLGTNVVWNVASGDAIYNEAHERPATFPSSESDMLSPDGTFCLWTTNEGRIAVVGLDSEDEPTELTDAVPQVDWRATQVTAFSHNGRFQAVALVGGAIEVRDTAAEHVFWSTAPLTDVSRPLKEGPSLELATSDISAFAVSNDGTFVIATTHSGEIFVITDGDKDAGDGNHAPERLAGPDPGTGEPLCVALSPNDRTAVMATIDGSVIRVDVDSTLRAQTVKSETLATIDDESLRCSAIAIDSTSRTVAMGLANGSIELRSLATFTREQSLTGADGPIRRIAFSEDSRQIACTTDRGTAVVWDVVDGTTPKATAPRPADAQSMSNQTTVAFQPVYRPRGPVRFSVDGTRLYVGRVMTIDILDVTNGDLIDTLEVPGSDPRDLALRSSDDHWLASRAWGEVYEWAPTVRESMVLQPDEQKCRFVQFTPDGKMLIAGGHSGVVRFFDTATGDVVHSGKVDTGGAMEGAVSPDGTKLAVCGMATGIEVWDIPLRKSLGKYYGHESRVQSVAFSPDSKLVASGSEDGTVRIREVSSKKQIQKYDGHTLHPTAVAFSPDGTLLLSATSNWKEQDKNGVLRVWDVASGKLVNSVSDPFGQVQGIGFSPFDGSIAVTVAGTILRLRDVTTCQVTNQFSQAAGLNHPRFFLHGRLMVYVEHPSTIHVHDVLTGGELTQFRTDTMVFELATLPHGNVVAAACEDGTVRVWRLGN